MPWVQLNESFVWGTQLVCMHTLGTHATHHDTYSDFPQSVTLTASYVRSFMNDAEWGAHIPLYLQFMMDFSVRASIALSGSSCVGSVPYRPQRQAHGSKSGSAVFVKFRS